MEAGEEVGTAGTGVGCSEEDYVIGVDVDGVELSDVGCRSTRGVCECLPMISVEFSMEDIHEVGVLF